MAQETPPSPRQLAYRVLCACVPPGSTLSLQIEPKGDRVLVKVADQEQKTKGGILLPVAAQKRPTSGDVQSLGDGRMPDGNVRPFFLKEGQTVRSVDTGVGGWAHWQLLA
jgi:co-chaperonin GroES (HSP10)